MKSRGNQCWRYRHSHAGNAHMLPANCVYRHVLPMVQYHIRDTYVAHAFFSILTSKSSSLMTIMENGQFSQEQNWDEERGGRETEQREERRRRGNRKQTIGWILFMRCITVVASLCPYVNKLYVAWWEYIDVPPRTETFPCEFFHPLCCYPQLASWCRWCCAEYCKASCTKSVKLLSFMKVQLFSHSTVWSAVYLVLSYNQWRRSLGRVTDNSGSANGLDSGSWSCKGSNKTNNISPSSNHEWRRKHVRVTYVCMLKNYKLLQVERLSLLIYHLLLWSLNWVCNAMLLQY